ncbi:protein serine/threonine kinase activating protein nimO [Aspergillus mulundensis]|uniref:G1 regulator n=1 Tax=Aspergillus mulundensis TaxID=1810919 RepID=A0A3D8S553_9EURO|nr:G1 regulator [Aspergillus mulundensis]RDW81437.1 G1 regulator [Aspergillus mulundensis]
MSTRRPLANVPNATNSPHRVGLVPAKRPRTTNAQVDIPYGQPPPKKQVVDVSGAENQVTGPTKFSTLQGTDSKLFTRKTNNAQPSAFEKKLVAARDKERQPQKATKQEKPSAENISIRQWQRHYRKAFPHFVFYFDAVPIDVRGKCSRQVIALGAREEKFFSRLVTHVVTSRPIPPEVDRRAPTESTHDTPNEPTADGAMLQTVNPAELEMHLHLAVCPKREQSQDVLHRAREMGMKIWAVEKLQRMIATINDTDLANGGGYSARNNAAGTQTKSRGKDDLSQVLQNELNGPTDRSHLSVLKDLVLFKGPFIYVHDMDEKTRPVMVREFPKVAKRQDGIWPQFRSAPLGKCPFIEDVPSKRDIERRARQEKEKKEFIKPAVPQPRHAAVESRNEKENVPLKKETSPAEEDEPAPPCIKEESPDAPQELPMSPKKSSESFVPPQLNRKGPFYHGREPAASGVQPSNITSAIRSQMVSSTAAAPGAKAGLSKEVHELKRKVLEKSHVGYSTNLAQPYRTLDTATAVKTDKANGSKPLVNMEEGTQSEGTDLQKSRIILRRSGEQRKKERRRDPKPGYCENCRDKFDDFDEHVMTRKHRKFAANSANWAELDSLLFQLERPLKEEYDFDSN